MAILLQSTISYYIAIQVIEDMISQNICHNPQTSSQNSLNLQHFWLPRPQPLYKQARKSTVQATDFSADKDKVMLVSGLFPQGFIDLCERFQCPHTSNGYRTSPQMMWNIAVVPVDSDQRCILELAQDSFRSKSDGWNCFAGSHFNNRQLGSFRQIFEPLVEAALLFLNDPTVHSPVTKHQHIGPCRFSLWAPWQRTALEAPEQVDATFGHAFGADGLTICGPQGRAVLLHDGCDFLPGNQCTDLHRRHQKIRKVGVWTKLIKLRWQDGGWKEYSQQKHAKTTLLRQLWIM